MPVGRPSRLVIFDRLDRAVDELTNVGGLPHPAEAEGIWESLWYEETHHPTAIEGNTLILKEVKALLDEGRAVGEKELREYLEVQGYAEAASWVYQQAHRAGLWSEAALITLAELREIHRLSVEPVWRHVPPPDHDPNEGPGSFRRHNIEPLDGGMKPPPWPEVPPLVTDWVEAADQLRALADSDLSLIALRRAAERGRLRALRRSDQWYSTRIWVDEYKTSRRRGQKRPVRERPTTLPQTPERLRFP